MKRNDIVLRSLILAAIAGGSMLFFTIGLRAPAWPASSGVSYPQVGVRFFWERDVVVVRLDDREERVRRADVATSPIYQEAMARVPAGDQPAATAVPWSRVLRYWFPLNALVWWVLFRLWQPLRPYVDGASVALPISRKRSSDTAHRDR